MDRSQRAQEILKRSPIATLATVADDGQPRSTPVTAAWDDNYNCYWTSFSDTEHSKNIRVNPSIFISLFDAQDELLKASGIYVKARAIELSEESEIDAAATYVYSSKGKPVPSTNEFIGGSPKRIYKATPERMWVSLREDFEIDPKTSRKEITL